MTMTVEVAEKTCVYTWHVHGACITWAWAWLGVGVGVGIWG